MGNHGLERPSALPQIAHHLVQSSALSCQTPNWGLGDSITERGALPFLSSLNLGEHHHRCKPPTPAGKHWKVTGILDLLGIFLATGAVPNPQLTLYWCFMYFIWVGPHKQCFEWVGHDPHFSAEESEAQRGTVSCPAWLGGGTQTQVCVTSSPGSGAKLHRPAEHKSAGTCPSSWAADRASLCSVPLYHRQQRPDRVHSDHQGRQHAPAVPGCRHLPDELGGAWRVQAGLGSGQVRRPSAGTMAESSGSCSRLAVQTPTKVSSLRSSSNDVRATWTDYHWQKLEYLTDKSQVPFDQNPILTPLIRYQIRCFAEYVYDCNYMYCF